jgi:hypothetical protein
MATFSGNESVTITISLCEAMHPFGIHVCTITKGLHIAYYF